MRRTLRTFTSAAAAGVTAIGLGVGGAGIAGAAPVLAANTPEIQSLWLADANTDALIGQITDGKTFNSDELGSELTIVAMVNGLTESVQFGNADQLITQTESFEPYALNGDLNGDLAAADLHIGTNVVRATPYGADYAEGTKGTEVLMTFSILPSTYRVDTTSDGHDAKPGDGVCSTAAIDSFASRSTGDNKGNDNKSTDNIAVSRTLTAPPTQTAARQTRSTGAARCTLRAAIEETNARPGWQRIEVPNVLEDYRVDLGPLDIDDTVKIEGVDVNPGGSTWPAPTLNANGKSVVIEIWDTGPVTLSWLRITGGDAQTDRGGGVQISNAPVTIEDCEIFANRANIGGGVYAQSTLIGIERSTIRHNTAGHPDNPNGGGQTQRGGGVAVVEGGAIIEASTIEGNRAVRGAGIYSSYAVVQTTNVEIVDNEANTRGGGMEIVNSTAQLSFTTIADNVSGTSTLDGPEDQVGGGIVADGSTLEMANSILANNVGAFDPGHEYYSPDCYTLGSDAEIVSRRGNVVGTLTSNCDFNDVEFEFVLLDSVGFEDSPLDPGFNYGTYVPGATSPALDNGVDVPGLGFFTCPTSDRGGFTTRAQGPACDSGAWERSAG